MSFTRLTRLPCVSPDDVPPPRARKTVVVQVHGPLGPDEIRRLCDQVRTLLAGDSRVICDVQGQADLGVVNALAHLHLMARRLDAYLRVQVTGENLAELLELTGLEAAVPAALEPGGQAEAGEERRVQEVVDVRDLPT
jgi:ABC-type transporter Mla MlaB component